MKDNSLSVSTCEKVLEYLKEYASESERQALDGLIAKSQRFDSESMFYRFNNFRKIRSWNRVTKEMANDLVVSAYSNYKKTMLEKGVEPASFADIILVALTASSKNTKTETYEENSEKEERY